MRIFAASIDTMHTYLSKFNCLNEHQNYLISYFQYQGSNGYKKFRRFIEHFDTATQNILLDSGAFGAWTRGDSINIDEYIQFIHEFSTYFFEYVELDVKADSNISLEESVNRTQTNQKIMEDAGLTPIPVYHALTKDFKYLESLLEKYEYIMIGGMAGEFFDIPKEVSTIFELNQKYNRKLHGLGKTSLPFCLEFPFYSVDSTTWLIGGITSQIQAFDWTIPYLKHISTKDKNILNYFPDINLFDIEDQKNYQYRNLNNLKITNYLEKFLTEIWTERGVVWN